MALLFLSRMSTRVMQPSPTGCSSSSSSSLSTATLATHISINLKGANYFRDTILEPISKMHLTLNICVTDRLKMLTYYRVCCAFSSAGVLILNVIYYF